MVAIPTGIISAGFVEQYSHIKRISEYANEADVHFIKVKLTPNDSWSEKKIFELRLPHGLIIAAIQRGKETLVPRGDVVVHAGDTLVLGAESIGDDRHIDLKEILLRKHNPWNGMRIRDLDISRQTLIVMVKRKNKVLIPNGNMILQEGDRLIMYSRTHLSHSKTIHI